MRLRYKIALNSFHLLALIVLCLAGVQTKAQVVISSNGGSFKGATVQLDWTIGEPVTETFQSEGKILTQGFHQSKLTVSAVDQIALGGIQLKVFPNPVSDQLILEMEKREVKRFEIELCELSGKLLLQKETEQPNEIIDMKIYRSGCYFLRIRIKGESTIQTFKIIKE